MLVVVTGDGEDWEPIRRTDHNLLTNVVSSNESFTTSGIIERVALQLLEFIK